MSARHKVRLHVCSVLFFCVILLSFAVARAQDCVNYADYSHWLAVETAGLGQSVAVRGNYAYLGLRDTGLKVIDISDPSDPEEVGALSAGTIKAWYLALNDSVIYIADHDYGIRVIDISDPTSPVLINSLALSGNTVGVTRYENHLYVAAKTAGLYILNIDNPENPVQVGHLGLAGKTRNVVVEDSIAYVADKTEMLKVIDVSDPSTPDSIGCAITGGLLSVVKSGDYVYAVGGYDLYVIDVSDPRAPAIIYDTPTQGTCIDATLYGDRIYVANEYYIVTPYDISDPTQAVTLRDIRTGWDYPRGVDCEDGYCYVATSYGLVSIALGNGDVLSPVGECYPFPGSLDAVAAFGDHYAFGASGNGQCHVFDISDPLSPSRIGGLTVSGGNDAHVAVTWIGGTGDVGLVGGYGGVHVIDLSEPSAPVFLCFVNCLAGCENPKYGFVLDVDVHSDYAFATVEWTDIDDGWWCHLDIIDLNTPGSAYIASRKSWCGETIDIRGDYAYLAAWSGGIHVLDISHPTLPVHVNTISSPDRAEMIVVEGGYGCGGFEVSGGGPDIFYLQVYDAEDPEWLDARGRVTFENPIVDFQVVDGIAYVSVRNGALFACNVSDPDNPYIMGALYSQDRIWDSELAGDLILIAGRDGGLEIAPLDCTDVAGVFNDGSKDGAGSVDRPELAHVHPNPFQGTTTLSFSLCSKSHVSLSVYDVRGMQVAVIVDGVLDAGWHTATFEGKGLAPGVYLATLKTGSGRVTRKVTLLR